MSGTVTPPVDTSAPLDRVQFCELLTAGRPSVTLATKLQNCQIQLPIECAYILDLPANTTFAQGAARVMLRWGPPGYAIY